MPKLGIFSGAKVCDILRSQGFELVRQRGSHMVMQRRAGETTITVPVPNHREIRLARCNPSSGRANCPRNSSSAEDSPAVDFNLIGSGEPRCAEHCPIPSARAESPTDDSPGQSESASDALG